MNYVFMIYNSFKLSFKQVGLLKKGALKHLLETEDTCPPPSEKIHRPLSFQKTHKGLGMPCLGTRDRKHCYLVTESP